MNAKYGTRTAVMLGDFLFAQSSWFLANLNNLEVRTENHSVRDHWVPVAWHVLSTLRTNDVLRAGQNALIRGSPHPRQRGLATPVPVLRIDYIKPYTWRR